MTLEKCTPKSVNCPIQNLCYCPMKLPDLSMSSKAVKLYLRVSSCVTKLNDILIISGSYGGHRQHTTYDGRQTASGVWHKLPTGELKNV